MKPVASLKTDWCHVCKERGEMVFVEFDASGVYLRICEPCVEELMAAIKAYWGSKK